jgi:hypothetical protein
MKIRKRIDAIDPELKRCKFWDGIAVALPGWGDTGRAHFQDLSRRMLAELLRTA